MDEQKAVEYLDSLKKRAFMTMNEVDLANLIIKYKNELSKEKEKNRKAIDVLDNSSHYLKICVDNDLTPMQLASKILRGEE